MNHRLNRMFAGVGLCAGLLLATGAQAQGTAAGENVALHKTVKVDPPSNYEYTRDRHPAQLTDGIYASSGAKWDPVHQTSSLWVQKGTLGWAHKKPVFITIDLGSVQPISGIIFSTAGGRAGVGWPEAIYMATSDDNKTWHYAGELVRLSHKNGQPPAEGYANFRYTTHDLKTRGRYVALGVLGKTFVFVDEIEVLRGDKSLLEQPAGKEIPPIKVFVANETITSAARRRMIADIDAIRTLMKESQLSADQRKGFEARLARAADAAEDMDPLPPDFKTIVPLNDIHRDILAVHGEAMAASGVQPLAVWKRQRYAWVPLIHRPEAKGTPALDFSMLGDQIRSDALLLTNATGQPMTVRLRLENPPAGVSAGWIKFDSAIWTDTQQGIPVQDALMPMEEKQGAYSLEIPAGVTGKVWVTVDTGKAPAGDYSSALVIDSGSNHTSVPLHLAVSKIKMGTPRLSLGMWDYTDGKGSYGITPENREAAIRMMRSHFVDSPWAKGSVLPTPKASDFDAQDQLKNPLKLDRLDEWIAMWPGVRRYFIFYSIESRDTFAGAQMGTPQFNARVGSWIKAIVAHLQSKGVKPSRVVICPVDESRRDEMDLHLVKWGEAIKAAVPEIILFSDPIWRDPTKAKYQEAFTIPDILCPHPGWSPEFYQKLAREHGKELWLYNGYGLGRLGDPQLGYRQMAWRVFAIGGRGEGFWSFGDLSGAATSWNEYTAARPTYAPAFLDKTTVYNSIHWDAAREGVEDFEELSMLADAIAASKDEGLKAQAQQVLETAVKAVNSNAGANDKYQWPVGTDPTVVDAQLVKVRAMLAKLHG